MEIIVDLDKVRELIESKEFINFLLDNTTEFSVAGFIMQTLLDKLEELQGEQ